MISYIKCNVWFEKHASDVYICISNIRRLPKSTVKCSEARRENARSKSFLIVLDLIDATLHRRRQNERLNWSEPGFVAPSWVKRYRLFFHAYIESLAKNCLQMSEMPSFDRNFFFSCAWSDVLWLLLEGNSCAVVVRMFNTGGTQVQDSSGTILQLNRLS